MFTLAISYLTTFILLWFMDLTFQVPMQDCSLQHRTSLPSPVISTIGCCFCFGSISSFFLELFLHCSPVAYWAPIHLGSLSFSVHREFIFHITEVWATTNIIHKQTSFFCSAPFLDKIRVVNCQESKFPSGGDLSGKMF